MEVQVRTELQHAWAQVFEAMADVFGRQIKYGEPPSVERYADVDIPMLVEAWRHLAEKFERVERLAVGVVDPAAVPALESHATFRSDVIQVARVLFEALSSMGPLEP